MDEYSKIIKAINEGLSEFSKFLNRKVEILHLPEIAENPAAYLDLTSVSWEEGRFPNSQSLGVYFMLARSENNREFLSVYIGKASHNSSIGKRLCAHLAQPLKVNKIYPIKDKSGERFNVEFISSIAMDEIYFFAPALEEFLIYFLQEREIHLLNGVGKS